MGIAPQWILELLRIAAVEFKCLAWRLWFKEFVKFFQLQLSVLEVFWSSGLGVAARKILDTSPTAAIVFKGLACGFRVNEFQKFFNLQLYSLSRGIGNTCQDGPTQQRLKMTPQGAWLNEI